MKGLFFTVFNMATLFFLRSVRLSTVGGAAV
jgi:hypothetical protein